jgi:hypothetical protein
MSVLRRICPPIGMLIGLGAAWLTVVTMPGTQIVPVPTLTLSDSATAGQGSAAAPAPQPRAAATVQLEPDIWNRPLFAPDRRQPVPVTEAPVLSAEPVPDVAVPVPEVAEPVVAPPPLPAIRMLGSMSTDGQIRALVSLAESGTEIWVETGHVFDEWILTKISQSDIQLTYQTTEVTIQLFE